MTALAACFYTDPVNRKPRSQFDCTNCSADLRGRDSFTLSAGPSDDPDGRDTIRSFFWEARFCESLAVPWASCAPNGESTNPLEFSPSFPTKGVVRVRLTVTDEHGASDMSEGYQVATDTRPEIEIIEESGAFDPAQPDMCPSVPFKFAARFRARWRDHDCCTTSACCELSEGSCQGDTDFACDDLLPLEWHVAGPSASRLVKDVGFGTDLPPRELDPVDETGRTFYVDPDVGSDTAEKWIWTVWATFKDAEGLEIARSNEIVFCTTADNPPCVELTDPPREADLVVVKLDGAPRTFKVLSVRDAADPYPDPGIGSQLTFQWFAGPHGSVPTAVPGATGPTFVFDHSDYDQLDRATVRVEVYDRVEREACPSGSPSCPAEGGDCVQRQSWTVEVR